MRFLDTQELHSDMALAVASLSGTVSTPHLKHRFFTLIPELQGVALDVSEDEYLTEFCGTSILGFLKQKEVFRPADLNPNNFFDAMRQAQISAQLTEANRLILDADANLHLLLNRLLATVAVFDIANKEIEGGSVSGCIGMVYLCPKEDWDVTFYAEMLVHEYVHNRLFLDDMVNGLFPDLSLLKHPEAQVTSTIRRTKREYDKSFHAACVSCALAYFYDKLGDQTKTEEFILPVEQTLRELEEVDKNLRGRGLEIITDHARGIRDSLCSFLQSNGLFKPLRNSRT